MEARQLGGDCGQGWLFAEPLNTDAAGALLAQEAGGEMNWATGEPLGALPVGVLEDGAM
jgi:hypothetical protein